jgi:putative ABC transport system permease protein
VGLHISVMIKNYFIIAFRNLIKTKGFSIINISGLAVGMATALLIGTWIYHEVSFDQFHENRNNIYQAWNKGITSGELECWPNTPTVLGPTLKSEYGDVAEVARVSNRWFVTIADDRKLSTKAIVTDPAFLKIFSFPFLHGDRNTALKDGNSIVVTEKMALKMFDNTNVLGKQIKIDDELYHVTGVLKDLPSNTDLFFEYLLPWDQMRRSGEDEVNWGNNSVFTYVMLNDGVSADQMNKKIKDVSQRHSNGEVKEDIFLHPMRQWHLYSRFENGEVAGGRIEIVRMFGLIGIFVLIVACINFMNLTTARSEKRAKEVGVRKVAGAERSSLVWQFLIESVALSLIAGIIAIGILQMTMPLFNTMTNQAINVPVNEPVFWIGAVGFIVLTGLFAGSYPAFFLSSFRPVHVLKGTFKRPTSFFNPRKILVVSQFTFAVVLIISTLVVVEQINYTQARDRGYKSEHLIYHWMTGDLNKNYQSLKSELIGSGAATSVSRTLSPLSMIVSSTWDIQWPGKAPDDKTDFHRLSADEHIVETASLKLIQGRDLDLQKYPSDSTGMLVNEAAAKVFGFKDPIGQEIKEGDGTMYHIVGVVQDFITLSPDENVQPTIMGGVKNNGFNVIQMKLNEQLTTQEAVAKVQELFMKHNPEYPFEFHFAQEDYALKFQDNRVTAALVSIFTVLTIFISCLGLFGLANYMAETRVKEIGIRKVLGASVMRIATLISQDFVKLVLIAIIIGAPLAWYLMSSWLEGFSYHTTIGWITFAAAGGSCLILAIITVGYQAVVAALADPVKSLKNE